ncbi:hypothetical protein RCL1_001431 [Eukaryota sp. TZLM3-RCL]
MPSVSSDSTPTRVKRVGNYSLGSVIGEGTFGKVRKATHLPTNATVAMKILEKAKIQDHADIERITREIRILRLLDHPSLIRLLEVIDSPRHLYLVMDYASGGELFDYIVAHTRIKEKEACKFFHQLVNGVDYCHRHKIIHRDLKPENILLDSKKNIRIIDFGLSNTMKPDRLLKTVCYLFFL